ncbi:GntR family transcriptional regulator [Nioella sediminis]|jgi:DNA-binding GntR family transcriptional regulator|uniref:GntR family transcriptional regulator n=1 Tax=Nioella sediminis TaxID=1912092 RepID=UPI0008FD3F62|nr:GntR family transcriptional regulator [Nioella sediminis]TBX23906.1 transcriptional regulator [Roseovarius sp. JS7-11]
MSAPAIAPLDPTKLRENAYFALRDAFTRGAFAPGDVLTLRDLAAQLGVSMTPVREAVRRLVAEGALVDTPTRKLMVPAFDARRAGDLMAARLAMEALALDQSMDRMSETDLAALDAILARVPDTPGNMPDLVTNHEFHFTLYRIGGSEVLLPIVEALWLQYGAYLNLIINRPAASEIEEHVHHFELMDALRRGDRDAAHAALKADITRSFNFLLPPE